MPVDRKKMKEELVRRTKEANERKDGEMSLKYFRSDVEIPLWRNIPTKEEPHLIDIIPFTAGKNFPQIDPKAKVKEGDIMYAMELYAHTNVGPGKDYVLCPTKNYGQPCPICEDMDKRSRDGEEWEDYQEIAPKKRVVYNILCLDTQKEEDKGIQVLEGPYSYFEKVFQQLAKLPREGGVIPFAHPDKEMGKSISFETGGDTYRKVTGHKFVDRNYDIPDDVLKQSLTLDDLLNLLTYDEIYTLYWGDEKEEKRSAKDKEVTKDNPPEDDIPIDDKPAETTSRRERVRNREEKKEESGCPMGHKFGVDTDKTTDCPKCPDEAFQKCGEEAERIEAEIKKKQEEAKPPAETRRRTLRRDK